MFARYDVSPERVVILKPMASRADIKNCLEISDLYLDSIPYGGATSLIDPLEVATPPVIWEGDFLRFRQASALLREIGLDDLITGTEDEYVEMVVRLAGSRALREQYREIILTATEEAPPFRDSKTFSDKIGKLFKQLFDEYGRERV